ncbi:preprotein translocase subunit YajC [Gorillibacterium massiliense]|uniref:preprotein translocase subunit YajC n=1 Tax=Gorillibacterium massiliense TaxID=1280390 RepID=UPI0004AFB2E1|nr:preprotein translocase subunit YajC [Gorillibacterium massiliense]
MNHVQLLAADTGGGGGGGGGGGYLSFVYIAIMFVALYFLLLRPQQKRQKRTNTMQSSMKKGDKVITIGGLHGTIMELDNETVVIRVNDATKMTFNRSAISSVVSSAVVDDKEK